MVVATHGRARWSKPWLDWCDVGVSERRGIGSMRGAWATAMGGRLPEASQRRCRVGAALTPERPRAALGPRPLVRCTRTETPNLGRVSHRRGAMSRGSSLRSQQTANGQQRTARARDPLLSAVGCQLACAIVPSTTPTSTEDRRYLRVQTGRFPACAGRAPVAPVVFGEEPYS